jgi:hypothetical protein
VILRIDGAAFGKKFRAWRRIAGNARIGRVTLADRGRYKSDVPRGWRRDPVLRPTFGGAERSGDGSQRGESHGAGVTHVHPARPGARRSSEPPKPSTYAAAHRPDPPPALRLPPAVTLTALVGTEKRSYFRDPAVQRRLAELGFVVELEDRRVPGMAARDLKGYDVAFPSSAPVAEKIVRPTGRRASRRPSTPR